MTPPTKKANGKLGISDLIPSLRVETEGQQKPLNPSYQVEGQDSAIEYEEHARNAISSLDVSVQAQVLNLLKELQSEFNLTYIFISHDLSVVKFMSDCIMVMNKGCIEELGPADRIYDAPDREYTKQFIRAIPVGSLERIRELQTGR